MSWVAVAIGGSALIGAGASVYSSNQASEAAARGGNAASAETARQFNLVRGDTAPYRNIGTQALNTLGSAYGYAPIGAPGGADDRAVGPRTFKPSEIRHLLSQGMSIDDILRLGTFEGGAKTSDIANLMRDYNFTSDDISRLQQGRFSPIKPPVGAPGAPGGTGAPDYSAFFRSPDYQFRRSEGTRGIENTFSAQGGARSGNALRALAEFNSGLAGGEFGNWFNRQAALAGIGQTATGQSAQAGMNAGNAAANIFQNTAAAQGNARASGVQGVNDALQGGIQNWMLYRYLRPGAVGG